MGPKEKREGETLPEIWKKWKSLHPNVHVHAACPCCMPMSMLHAHVYAAYPCPCCMYMSILHVHVHAACSCPCCMFMPMLHAHAACPCSCCMPVLMLHTHAHAACPQTVSFWTTKYAAFCKGDVNRASYNAVPSLMAKITEVMVILLRDTMAKACSHFNGRMRL